MNSDLEEEARFLLDSLFSNSGDDAIVARYVDAHRQLFADQITSPLVTQIVAHRLDAEAVEYALRRRNAGHEWLVGRVAGLRVADTQTGLRGWPRRCCERNVRNPATGFEFNLATLLEASAMGETIIEVPIETIYEPGNPSSHFRPLHDSARIYGVLARHAARRVLR